VADTPQNVIAGEVRPVRIGRIDVPVFVAAKLPRCRGLVRAEVRGARMVQVVERSCGAADIAGATARRRRCSVPGLAHGDWSNEPEVGNAGTTPTMAGGGPPAPKMAPGQGRGIVADAQVVQL